MHGDDPDIRQIEYLICDRITNSILAECLHNRCRVILGEPSCVCSILKRGFFENIVGAERSPCVAPVRMVNKSNLTRLTSYLRPVRYFASKHLGELLEGKVLLQWIVRTNYNRDLLPTNRNEYESLSFFLGCEWASNRC